MHGNQANMLNSILSNDICLNQDNDALLNLYQNLCRWIVKNIRKTRSDSGYVPEKNKLLLTHQKADYGKMFSTRGLITLNSDKVRHIDL